MDVPNFIYTFYERSLLKQLKNAHMPQHIGVILDGNRRWAKKIGSSTSYGHQKGADKIAEFLSWCEETHIPLVTLWLLSTDNLKRSTEELNELADIICNLANDLAASKKWKLNIVGALDLLPSTFAQQLCKAAKTTSDIQAAVTVNIAVSYGGQQEIIDAVKEHLVKEAEAGKTLHDAATSLCVDDINSHVYTSGQPNPDLVIRTSGEIRLSGFMLWQSVHTELYFCETYWPDFRRTDFLRALRDYSLRDRRLGA